MPRTAAILLAAGSSRRMRGAVPDKVLAPLAGRPVFTYSAAAFMASGVADFYAVVYRDQRQMLALAAYAPTPAVFVRGGREREDSVRLALAALPSDIATVFIHDCARPLIRPARLRELLRVVRRRQAVVLAHRVTDTIKEQRGRLRTLDRSRLWAMETPQVFARELIARGYARALARRRRVTDDAGAVELLGRSAPAVALLENDEPNPKLTAPADFIHVELLLRQAPADSVFAEFLPRRRGRA
jgi:2-C-methyl-D-erythritol 4-phosphate cytidylyltransferase